MRITVKARVLLLAVAAATAAVMAIGLFDRADKEAPLPNENYRIPTERPPVEPDRPDLFEEPGRPEETR